MMRMDIVLTNFRIVRVYMGLRWKHSAHEFVWLLRMSKTRPL